MARPFSTSGGRPVIVNVRLSQQEAAQLDAERRGLSRSTYLRGLIASAGGDSKRPQRSTPTNPPGETTSPSLGPPTGGRAPCTHPNKNRRGTIGNRRCGLCGERGLP